jgi:hypothetical protein
MAVPNISTLGGLLAQVRTLLQDTDAVGGYRYSDESIVTNINQSMMDAYRMRPDLFLATGFVIPAFDTTLPNTAITIEPQYLPAFVYYVTGLTQARDDEQNQDARAMGFLKIFQQTIVNGGIA